MRKAIAALIAVALTVLTFGTPAQALTQDTLSQLAADTEAQNGEMKLIPVDVYPLPYMDTRNSLSLAAPPFVGHRVDVELVGPYVWGGIGRSLEPEIQISWFIETENGPQKVDLEEHPIYSYEFIVPESLLGKRLRAVVSAHLEGYEFESVTTKTSNGLEWLPPVVYPPLTDSPQGEVKVEGAEANDSRYVLTGSKLTYSMQSAVPEGAYVDCKWMGRDADDVWKPEVELGNCQEPLILDGSHVGLSVFARGEVKSHSTHPSAFVVQVNKEVRLPSTGVTLNMRKPRSIKFDEPGLYEIDLVNTNEIEVDLIGVVGRISRVGSVSGLGSTSPFTWTPSHYMYVGEEFEIEAFVNSENYDRISLVEPLGKLLPGDLPVATTPVIEPLGRWASLSGEPLDASGRNVCTWRSCTYDWRVNGSLVYSSTSSGELALGPDHFGKPIDVTVVVSSPGFNDRTLKSNSITIWKEYIGASAPAGIRGSVKVGSAVSATFGDWAEPGVTTTYQWYQNGKVISGATKSSYTIPPSLVGKEIQVKVMGSHELYKKTPSYSPRYSVKSGTIKMLQKPVLTGGSSVGSTLKVSKGKWSPSSGGETYSWYVNGKKIKHTATTLKLTPDLLGKRIKVRMNVNEVGYKSTHSDSADVVVTRSTAKISGKLSSTSIRKGKSAKLAVTVKVPGTSKPTGKVTVTVGKKTFTKTVSISHAGKVTVYLYGLSTGSNQAVKVKFTPSSSTAKFSKSSATTTVGKITVKK